MEKEQYDRKLVRWVKNHYWDSLEMEKDLILRHLRTFTGDQIQQENAPDKICTHPRGYIRTLRICGLCGEQVGGG